MQINFSGTWKANLSQSKLLTATPSSMIVRVRHEDPELEEEILVTRTDGSETRATFCCRTNGDRIHTQLNGSPIHGGAHWEDDELVIESWLRAGPRELHLCDRWSLSDDGRTLTMEHRDGDLAGQRTVFDRAE